jgi:hypothetical protein
LSRIEHPALAHLFVGLLRPFNPEQTLRMLNLKWEDCSPSALGISSSRESSDSHHLPAARIGQKSGLRAPVVKGSSIFLLSILFFVPSLSFGQNLSTKIQLMKAAYSSSGSLIALDGDSIVISPKMPSPICGMLMNKEGKPGWSFYTFPLASITVPLSAVDESLIVDNLVFTDPNVVSHYKPGDVGETTMVIISGMPGKQFHTLIYDREKFSQLGPGPHSSSEYGQAADDTLAFGLTFSDPESAHAFELALKDAVMLAKQRMGSQASR